jgi:biotin carboxyl carrier protein
VDSLAALSSGEASGIIQLSCPAVGVFRSRHAMGEPLEPGDALGVLSVLNRRYEILIPAGMGGVVVASIGSGSHGVGYGSQLASLERGASAQAGGPTDGVATGSESVASGEVLIRSPIDGIYYSRPEPGAAPFVAVGDEIGPGQVLALIEVMKTFNPIRCPEDVAPGAVVLRLEVPDHHEVRSGQVLLALGSRD